MSTSQTETIQILNARLTNVAGLQEIVVKDGQIETITPMSQSLSQPANSSLDVGGDWISLGGVDLQINGALGLAFPDLDPQHLPKLKEICQFLWQQGVDAFLPTLVTTAVEKIGQSLAVIAEYMQSPQPENAAQILGVHLEGPFLNPQKRGAHPQKYLLPLTGENLKRVLGDYTTIVKVMTLAPELDPTGETIRALASFDIVVSLGHSLATAAQAEKAFNLGASMVTHAFNAMPGLHHREPGLLGAALVHSGVRCGLIADGQHVCPTMLNLVLRAGGYSQGLFLVSDALAPIGLGDGVYPWDARQIEVKNGTARLADGTLAGTTLPLLAGVENLLGWDICDVGEAIALATDSPRFALGLPSIAPGQRAHLLRWHWDDQTKQLHWQRLIQAEG